MIAEHDTVARPCSPPFGGVFAALDLGTNNCRMLVATPEASGFRVLDSFNRVVRLGEGLHATGRLSQTAMDRTLAALQACGSRLANRKLRGVRAIATAACRRAANGAEFLARARRETGLPIETISTREEAELALGSCAPLISPDDRRVLLFDIGGGSTEFGWVRLAANGRPELAATHSVPVGVVTLAERFGPSGHTTGGFESMVAEIAARLAAFEAIHCIAHEIRQGGVRLLGTSGTVTTLAGVALGLTRYRRLAVDGTVLTREAATRALALLRGIGREGLERHACVGPGRADLVLPGCAIFAAILGHWPAPFVIVADRGLREGMLLRMIEKDRMRASPGRSRI